MYSRLRMWCVHLFSFSVLFDLLQHFTLILGYTSLFNLIIAILSFYFFTCFIFFPVKSSFCFRLWFWGGSSLSTKNIDLEFWRFWSYIFNVLFWYSSLQKHRKTRKISCACIKEKLCNHFQSNIFSFRNVSILNFGRNQRAIIFKSLFDFSPILSHFLFSIFSSFCWTKISWFLIFQRTLLNQRIFNRHITISNINFCLLYWFLWDIINLWNSLYSIRTIHRIFLDWPWSLLNSRLYVSWWSFSNDRCVNRLSFYFFLRRYLIFW